MISNEQIMERLKTVDDPELYINIVDLGLIYNVEINEVNNKSKVKITMTLTTPGCPLGSTINMLIKDALFPIKEINVDKDVEILVTFDPPWTVDMMTEESKAELGIE